MQLLEHYARLYDLWMKRTEGRLSFVETSVPELSAWLHCTERNAKLLVKAMLRQGWLDWQPGRGRGHRSQMCCRAVPDMLLAEQARGLLHSGDIQGAVQLLHTSFLTEEGKAQLLQTLRQSFGPLHQGQGEDGGPRSALRFPSYRQLGSLDPAYASRRTELHWIRQLFDTLVRYDAERQAYCPGLAHSWECDSTASWWRFYLQKQVQFHNGAVFTAEDVRFTLERLMLPGPEEKRGIPAPYRKLFARIAQVKVLHEHAVEIRWHSGCYPCLALLTLPAASIVPAGLSNDWSWKPAGTGPFVLSRREERSVQLKANPFYYKRPANLDLVEMWCLPEIYEQEGREAVEVQEVEGMNFWHYWGGQQTDASWERVECMDRGCKYVLMNQTKEGLLQHKAWRDLLYRIIREGNAMEELGGNRGERADSFVRGLAEASWRFENKNYAAVETSIPFDPEGDKGFIRPLQLVTYAGAGHERDAAWLQRELVKHGIPLTVRMVEYERLLHPDIAAEADLLLLEQSVDADEEAAMWSILGSDQSLLRSCLMPEALQRLDLGLERLAMEPQRTERLQGLIRLERELLEDRAVVLWYRWRQMASFPAAMQGVKIGPLGWVNYKYVWFKE